MLIHLTIWFCLSCWKFCQGVNPSKIFTDPLFLPSFTCSTSSSSNPRPNTATCYTGKPAFFPTHSYVSLKPLVSHALNRALKWEVWATSKWFPPFPEFFQALNIRSSSYHSYPCSARLSKSKKDFTTWVERTEVGERCGFNQQSSVN